MTEESYQQCRKVMQKINHLRGMITTAKGNVGKWTKIESTFRSNLEDSRADGVKKMLDIHLKKLNDLREKFEMTNFPDSNIVVIKKKSVQCEGCGVQIDEGNDYCNECLFKGKVRY